MPDPVQDVHQEAQPDVSWAWVLTWTLLFTAILVAVSLVMLSLG